MRLPVAIAFCTFAVTACGGEPTPPAANRSSGAVSLRAIPSVGDSPVDYPAIMGRATHDLNGITETGILRVLVARSRTDYERSKGSERGRAVDAGIAFRNFLRQRTRFNGIVAFIETPEDALVQDLLDGKGDVAANVLLTFARDEHVAFSTPARSGIRELIVNGPKESHLVSLEDVGGRKVHVRRASDHHASLLRLNEQLMKIARPPAQIVIAPADVTDEDLLDQVNAGKIPATIVYDYVYDSCCRQMDGLKTNRDVAVSQDGVLAWATRKDAPQLLALLNEFFSTHAFLPGVP